MTTAIAERPITVPTVSPEQLDLVKRTVAKDATVDELKLYLYDCSRQGVHPLDKLIHFTKRSGKYTPITSIDFMRIRAADTGEYAGSDDAVFDYEPLATGAPDRGKPPREATVTVWRLVQGTRCPFTATARWAEYKPDQNDFMWKKMPCTMLGKCAEALALRKGFPRQLAGLYAAEEMDQASHPAASQRVAPDPPDTLQNVTTGELVPNVAGTPKPEPPDGYAYLTICERQQGGWLNVAWQGKPYSTKRDTLVALAEQAYQAGLPVKLHSANGKWIDKVETWKPRVEVDEIERTAGQDSLEEPF